MGDFDWPHVIGLITNRRLVFRLYSAHNLVINNIIYIINNSNIIYNNNASDV